MTTITHSAVVTAPFSGKLVPLSSVPDETFASGVLGEGIAIEPSDGLFCSPVSGTVESIAETRHAIGFAGDNGLEILVHVGLETVGLKGEGFEILVKEGDTYSFGDHTVTFVGAPMVHWPEAMVTFDTTNGVLFSADAFGSFIALDGKLFADEVNFDRDWIDEARRYLTNIVGKYGPHIQLLLGKAGGILDQIRYICPLHGPVWRKDLGYFIDKYDKWSRYEPEVKGVLIVYASMYGNTEAAAQALAAKLCERGITDVALYDVSNTHVSYLIAESFKYSHIVLASVTYNLGIYPVMKSYLEDMKALTLQNRTFSINENVSWACKSGDLMQAFIDEELKNMTVLNERLSLASSLQADKAAELDQLADALVESLQEDLEN